MENVNTLFHPKPGEHNMFKLRAVLLEQAQIAHKNGEIEKNDFRRLALATLFPSVLRRLETFIREQATTEGIITTQDAGNIDWTKIKDFIKDMLPIILEFLKIIGAFK